MTTYKDIQGWVKEHHGQTVKTCWIAHCKEMAGLPVRRASNRYSSVRQHPCPDNKQGLINDALKHFGMIPEK